MCCAFLQRYKRRLQEEKAMYWEQDAVLTELDAWTAKTHDMCERITVLLPHLEASYSRRPDAAQRVLATLQKQFHKVSTPLQMARPWRFCFGLCRRSAHVRGTAAYILLPRPTH